jgi:hypothetical protein
MGLTSIVPKGDYYPITIFFITILFSLSPIPLLLETRLRVVSTEPVPS